MDCHDARLLLAFARPGRMELAAADVQALQQHLETCPDCAALAAHERQCDAAIARAMHAVPVPMNLQSRLLARLAEARRPRLWPYVAAAAALLLAVGLGGWWWSQKPWFDSEAFVSRVERQAGARREFVESWFAEQGLAVTAPPRFDFANLESFDIARLQDQDVAKLTFHHRGDDRWSAAVAHVYVLSDQNLRWSGELPQSIPASGDHTVAFMPGEVTGFLYVAVYTGGSLDPFLIPRNQT